MPCCTVLRLSHRARVVVTLLASAALSPWLRAVEAQRPDALARGAARDAAQPQRTPSAFGTIDGVVTDSALAPLADVVVSVVGADARVVTSEAGRFRLLQVPTGQFLLIVRRVGYEPTSAVVEVSSSDTLRLAFSLSRTSPLLDTVRVRESMPVSRLEGFERRRREGIGQFVTQEEIERRGSVQTLDFIRNKRGVEVSKVTTTLFAGVQVYSKREGGAYSDNPMQNYCTMQVALDGVVLPNNYNLDLLPPPKQVAGIEIYTGAATVPAMFGGSDRHCGVIAVWTRSGR